MTFPTRTLQNNIPMKALYSLTNTYQRSLDRRMIIASRKLLFLHFNSPNSTSSASITITVEGRLHCCSMHSLLVTNTFRFDYKSLRWLISTAASVRSRRCSTLNWIPNVFCYGKKPILETASHTNRALIQPQEPNKTFVFIQNGLILELLPTNTNDGDEAPPKRRNCFIVKLVASSSGGHSSLKVIAYPNLICWWRFNSLRVMVLWTSSWVTSCSPTEISQYTN